MTTPPEDPYAQQPQQPQYPPPAAPQYGQPQYGQQPGQPPQYGQQPGQPQYPPPAAPQYGQPQYGQPQYGQQPGQQPQYGQYPPAPASSAYQTPQTGQGVPASMGSRLLARIIDALIIGIPAGIIIAIVAVSVADKNTCTTDAAGVAHCTTKGLGALLAVYFIFIIAFLLYEILMIGLKGATIGKRMMGIQVRDAATGGTIGAGRAFVRYLVLAITGAICTLGYWSPFFDSSRRYQGWHDKAANDFVVSSR
jgi:uncharacterized RDD family membrane protein YckC